MRQNHGSKRSRGRSSNRRSGPPRNQTFDSNGPSIRIRGNAFQVHEKYLALARDASSAGDRIAAENYLQHAEHYFRIMAVQREDAEARAGQQQQRGNGNGGAPRRPEHETTGYGTDGFDQPYDDGDDADEMPAFVRRKVAEPRPDSGNGDDSASENDSEPETEGAIGD